MRRTVLTTVCCRKSLQVDNQGKKTIYCINLPENWENGVEKPPKQNENEQQHQLENTTAMTNQLDFGGIGSNVMLAKVPLKSMNYLCTEQLKYGLWYFILFSHINCVSWQRPGWSDVPPNGLVLIYCTSTHCT